MKKVAIIFHDSNYMSGATRSMLDLIESWYTNDNVEIIAIFPRPGSAVEFVKKFDIQVICTLYYDNFVLLNDSIVKKFFKLPIYTYKYLFSLLKVLFSIGPILKEKNVDIIYSNTSGLYIGAFLQKYFSISHIWHFREFGEEDHNLGVFGGRKYFYKLANHYTNVVICISDALKEKYQPNIARSIVKVYDDVSSAYLNRRVQETKTNGYTFLVAGQLSEGKGQKCVIEAIAELKRKNLSVKLYIAGKEAYHGYMDYLKKLVTKYQLEDYICFLGQVENMNALRENIDFGIVASQSEAFGRVTLEGMLSGLIMICSRCGSNVELIKDGNNGFLYEFNDPASLAEVIQKVINLKNKNEIRENAYIYASEFTKSRGAKTIYEIMETL